ncbi:aminopeptidase P family protein [Candidatus Daviesbacteria bacterium]|nr:aminopeptidase P family protein [Candidatus Daviesbacteria bacterium]
MSSAQKLNLVQKDLQKQKVDAVLISSVPNITYLTGYSNFKVEEREAYLFITSERNYLITHALYINEVKKLKSGFKVIEYSPNNPLKNILKKLGDKNSVKRLGLEETNLTVKEYKTIKKIFKKTKNYNLSSLRIIKNSQEIEKIKRACEIGDKAFESVLKMIKNNIAEEELAVELELFIIQQKARLSFDTIIAFDKNSEIPHHMTNFTKLEKKQGQFILFDFGVKFKDYCSDMSRTVFWGKTSQKQKTLYKTVLEAQNKAVNYISNQLKNNKKIMANQADKIARNYIKSKGYPEYPHTLGHGVGIEVHEEPIPYYKRKEELKEGMVFSIEPGIYIPGLGGVRIEDLFVIENNKLRQLTNASKKLIEL